MKECVLSPATNLGLFCVLERGRDGEQMHAVAGERATEQSLSTELGLDRVVLDVVEVVLQVAVRVGVAVREVHRVAIVFERHRPR